MISWIYVKISIEKQINQIFMVTGGFAMFMNDTLKILM